MCYVVQQNVIFFSYKEKTRWVEFSAKFWRYILPTASVFYLWNYLITWVFYYVSVLYGTLIFKDIDLKKVVNLLFCGLVAWNCSCFCFSFFFICKDVKSAHVSLSLSQAHTHHIHSQVSTYTHIHARIHTPVLKVDLTTLFSLTVCVCEPLRLSLSCSPYTHTLTHNTPLKAQIWQDKFIWYIMFVGEQFYVWWDKILTYFMNQALNFWPS